MLRVAVVGARRVRQGTGEFIARELARQGCSVEAIVGTSEASCDEARRGLKERHGIDARAYLSIGECLEREKPDLVAIASPAEHHLEALYFSLEAGCHVFCEKPLFWKESLVRDRDGSEAQELASALVELASRKGRLLALNTQWPETLPAFRELHPRALEGAVESIEMWLAPPGPDPVFMVRESASHVLSLVYRVVGEGNLGDLLLAEGEGSVDLGFEYRSGLPRPTRVALHLRPSATLPRPAAYAINGHRVDRVIELPDYTFRFEAEGRRVPLQDPLALCVAAFLARIRSGEPTLDRGPIVQGMEHLARLVSRVKPASRGVK
jgi:hypothetical protein